MTFRAIFLGLITATMFSLTSSRADAMLPRVTPHNWGRTCQDVITGWEESAEGQTLTHYYCDWELDPIWSGMAWSCTVYFLYTQIYWRLGGVWQSMSRTRSMIGQRCVYHEYPGFSWPPRESGS